MEQLTVRDQNTVISRRDVAVVLSKVELRLSADQLSTLSRILMIWLKNWMSVSGRDLHDLAMLNLVFKLNQKLQLKLMTISPKIKMTLDKPTAWALYEALTTLDLDRWPYESSVQRYIISEIDRQTA